MEGEGGACECDCCCFSVYATLSDDHALVLLHMLLVFLQCNEPTPSYSSFSPSLSSDPRPCLKDDGKTTK